MFGAHSASPLVAVYRILIIALCVENELFLKFVILISPDEQFISKEVHGS
jgi:hypothetical protein